MARKRTAAPKAAATFVVLLSDCGGRHQLVATEDYGTHIFDTEAKARAAVPGMVREWSDNNGGTPARIAIAKVIDVAVATGVSWGESFTN